MDRTMARALTEAGCMPLNEYIRMFGGEQTEATPEPRQSGASATRPWRVPAHFASPAGD
jgi:hypothetical protein